MGACTGQTVKKRTQQQQQTQRIIVEAPQNSIIVPKEREDFFKSALFSDEQQHMLKEQIKVPSLLCQNKFPVQSICTKPNCKAKSSFLCLSKSCKNCSQEHQTCHSLQLKNITDLIKERTIQLRNFLEKILKQQKEMVMNMKEFRRSFVKKYRMLQLDEEFRQIGEMIESQTINYDIKGTLIGKWVANLEGSTQLAISQGDKMLKEFKTKLKNFTDDLNIYKQDLAKSFSSQLQTQKKASFSQSKLLSQESLQLIQEALNYPSKLELLFRASQHKFSASQFHRVCDGIPDTITIVKTEFKKIIAGYTPLAWESPVNWKNLADPSQSSFLLSLDLKQKMKLVKPDNAIYCDKNYGPVFGGYGSGWDLAIRDNCLEKSLSCSNFPSNYNSETPYSQSQKSISTFSGAVEGTKFKILEYEVYKVIK